MPVTRPFHRRRPSETGAELVEFAMVLPVLLLLLLGIADLGLMMQAYGVVSNAAREGARVAIITDKGYTSADVTTRVKACIAEGLPAGNASASTSVTVADVVLTVPLAGGGTVSIDTKRVTVLYPFSYRFIGGIARLFGRTYGTVNLRAVALMRLETPAE